ncbi:MULTISPECIES: thioredoxin domain-containing protein [Leuconostoc]|uniref:thioredoxin domain-containing protein n=1 Tax=Leuconostoc TaxID=1243 RepID=UPI000BBBE1B0|nr:MULTISPECIES: thioredoxin domain-containing protein [Leuconostoc]MCT4412021.1 thiol-disulfide isomerase [Leuconostoc falkenbergense]VTU70685.1 thioredoxin (plasmid) [Lactobacillus hokkaidonensis JCM] [Leuconostoc pseudomesenteroides]
MKHYIKGGNETKKGTKKQLPKPITIIVNKVLPVIVLLVAGFYFIPYVSMNFQNNDVDHINKNNEAVMFYSSTCSHCQKVYPKIFWHNVLNFKNTDKQIQTINVQNPNNKHYIREFAVQETPTFMKPNNPDMRVVSTDVQVINDFSER